MPDTEANADPRSFARADLGEAVGRLVEIIRRVRPQVVVTYPADQEGYPHPDHLRVHEITAPAVDAAADPAAYPGTGAPWTVSKIYYSAWSRARIEAMHEKFLELGMKSPYDASWFERPSQDRPHHHAGRHERGERRPAARPARPRHPGRPDVPVLVRPA